MRRVVVDRRSFESTGAKAKEDGRTGLAERPKVAGARAVAAGSNNEDGWQIDRGQKNADGASRRRVSEKAVVGSTGSPARVGGSGC